MINDELKIEKFEAFYQWLKEDGLTPKRSERLLKKRIYRNLLGCEKMTMENFEDFLTDEAKKKKEIFDSKEFEGKKIPTADGVLKISIVFPSEEGIKVNFTNGEFTLVPTVEALRKVVL